MRKKSYISEMDYELIDSGDGRKLERFGALTLIRPASQALWSPKLDRSVWEHADAFFSRDEENRWQEKRDLPETWTIQLASLFFKLKRTDFGHLGLFPEQAPFWEMIQKRVKEKPQSRVLNLFAYSGGASLAAAKGGAFCHHLDASKGMVSWARENAELNQIGSGISWIVEDVMKFLNRRIKREERYSGIILDPPSFGRGPAGQLFKIENELLPLLRQSEKLLEENPLFFLFTCHTPGVTPLLMEQMVKELFKERRGKVQSGEMMLKSKESYFLPSGSFVLWES